MVELHKLTVASLRPSVSFSARVNADDPWQDTIRYINRSFDQVEPLYKLQKEGELQKDAGKAFITERFADAASMLNALYWAAWTSSAPDERQVQGWLRFNSVDPALLAPGPAGTAPPATPSPVPAPEKRPG